LFRIEVDVEYPKLRGGKGVGQYVRCPACSFGSPMAMISSVVKPGDKFIVKVGLESEKEAG
jgi:hypothetical protein